MANQNLAPTLTARISHVVCALCTNQQRRSYGHQSAGICIRHARSLVTMVHRGRREILWQHVRCLYQQGDLHVHSLVLLQQPRVNACSSVTAGLRRCYDPVYTFPDSIQNFARLEISRIRPRSLLEITSLGTISARAKCDSSIRERSLLLLTLFTSRSARRCCFERAMGKLM